MLSVAVMMLFSIMFPAPPKPQAPPAGAQANGEAAPDADAVVAGAAAGADNQPRQGDQPAPVAALPQVAVADVPTQFATLGSLDPDSGYRMLVTLTSTGAAVRRAEMASPRYRDQDNRTGYLGELELKNVDGGVEVQVVGAGTPAAEATPTAIEPGDVIVGIGASQPTAIKTTNDLLAALAETKPRQELTLQVRHGKGAPQSRTITLSRRPFAALRPELDNYRMRSAEPPADFADPPSLLLSLSALNGKPLESVDAKRIAELLEQGNWETAAQSATSVTFRRALPELKLELIKRYTLQPVPPKDRDDVDFPGYHLQLDIELRNTADQAQTLAYRLDGPTGMPLEGWWYSYMISQRWFSAAGLRNVVVRFSGSSELQIDGPQIAEGDVKPMGDGQALAYVGVDGQYFAAVLIPVRKTLDEVWFDTTEAVLAGQTMVELEDGTMERRPKLDPRTRQSYTNVTCRLTRKPIELAPGAPPFKESFQVFIGPKRPDLLAQYQAAGDPNYSLKDIIYYGLALFGAVARAMLAILHFFHAIVGNYGVAIVMLTVLVRGAMFPISFKQTQNMARMQALKPEMDRITEKYKTDMQKRSQATQELYRKHKINPLGGCLPVFLQLPVFIGLYRALMVDVELRQSPLFGNGIRWCSNLAAPDMLLDWSSVMPDFINNGQGMFSLGPYLNILPLITVALFLVTQKLAMPPPTNEQAAMQQKMMKYMTIFMGLLFYKVASGLCLYFIASSLWGIAERKLLPKANPAGAAATGGTTGTGPAGPSGKRPHDGGTKPGPNGSPSQKPPKAKRKK